MKVIDTKENRQMKRDTSKPAYVTALEAAYGAPSQSGFGSAVFFEAGQEDADLEALAKKYHQYFVGDLWEEWGDEVWLAPWRETYRRPADGKPSIVEELKAVDDLDSRRQVDMILNAIDDAEAAREALSGAYDAPEVVDLRAYLIGDGEAMSGLMLAGQRSNGDATILVFLMD